MRNTPRHAGYVTVFVMLLLAVGLALTAWLYVALSNNTSIVKNDLANARAMSAAETGLQFMMHDLRSATANVGFINTDRAFIMEQLAARMVNYYQDLNTSWTPTATKTAFEVADMTLSQGSFAASLTLNPTTGSNGFRVSVTGNSDSSNSAVKVIGNDIRYQVIAGSSALDFAIASRGPMDINGAAEIYRLDTETDAADMTDPGVPVTTDNGSVLKFKTSAVPAGEIVFPDKYLPADMYTALANMKDHGLTAVTNPGAQTSFTNIYIPKNTGMNQPVVFNGNVTLNGIIYVEWPNSIEFGTNVTLNGVIIYGKRTPERMSHWPTIYLGRTLNVTSDIAAAQSSVRDAFTGAGYSSDTVKTWEYALANWIVHAPDTDLSLENGNTTGTRDFTGSFHIRNFEAEGSGTGGKDANNLQITGQIFCEGAFKQGGNRLYCIAQPTMSSNPFAPRRIKLDVDHGGYWEN